MLTNWDTHHQSTPAPDRRRVRDTVWVSPRDDSTAAKYSLAELMKNRVVEFKTPIYPMGKLVWPVDVGGTGQIVNPDPTDGTLKS